MSAFLPTAAVVVHSHVSLDTAVLETLRAEDFLLIHRCRCSATRANRRAIDTDGQCFLRVDLDPVIRFQVTASVLEASGLANYHPGRKLSAQALQFANGADLPFQFDEGPAVFIYENPTLDPGPGDLPTIEFTVAVEFSDLDSTNYPATSTDGGPGGGVFIPSAFVDLPVQTPWELSATWRNALLLDLFNSVDAFEGAPFTATLYDGNPAETGVALLGPITLDAWTNFSEVGYTTRAKNQSDVFWNGTFVSERTANYIRYERNGLFTDALLNAPLVIPAFTGVRAPALALALQLTWPLDGSPLPAAGDLPSRNVLTYAVGGARSALVTGTDLTVTASDSDYTTPTDFDSFTVAATDAAFTVSGDTVSVNLTGTNFAPGGGWDVEVIRIALPGGLVIVREAYPLAVTVGNPVTVTGVLLNLAAIP